MLLIHTKEHKDGEKRTSLKVYFLLSQKLWLDLMDEVASDWNEVTNPQMLDAPAQGRSL